MTPEEQIIFIAKLCPFVEWNESRPFWRDDEGRSIRFNPLKDLNAVRAAVEVLRSMQGPEWYDFQKRLMDECGSVMNCVQASAETRATVFIEIMSGTTT